MFSYLLREFLKRFSKIIVLLYILKLKNNAVKII